MNMKNMMLAAITGGVLFFLAVAVPAQETTTADNTGLSVPATIEPTAIAPLESESTPVPEPAPLVEESTPIAPPTAAVEEAPAVETPVAEGQPVAAEPPPASPDELIELSVEKSEQAPGVGLAQSTARPELLSISLDNVPLQEVVRLFTRVSGANIVSGTNLQGNVTVSLKDVEWEPALRSILESVNMTLVEKKSGIYSIVSISDLAGEPIAADTIFLRFTTVTNVLPVVRGMLISSNAAAQSIASANAILIKETAQNIQIIKQAIAMIDKPRKQVFIEAKFVELNDAAIKDIGVSWTSLGGDGNSPGGIGLSAKNIAYDVTQNRESLESREDTRSQYDRREREDVLHRGYDMDNAQVSGDNSIRDSILAGVANEQSIVDSASKGVTDIRTAILSASEFNVMLSALKQNEGVDVVSNPKVLVASGETALIHVGTQEPQIKSEYQPDTKQTTYTFDKYIDVGVKVRVTPVVNTSSNISLRIVPELSRKLKDVPVGDGTVTFPQLSTRTVETDFTLESGRTVAIGGLTTTSDREIVKKVPILGDIPIIGKYLFRHTHTRKEQDEVIIFVTVSMANAENVTETLGIPANGALIHRYLAQKQAGTVAKEKADRKKTDKAKPSDSEINDPVTR
ncbi:MAG: hypothetical protein V2A34_03525 [Lentisphaerota bacterium]